MKRYNRIFEIVWEESKLKKSSTVLSDVSLIRSRNKNKMENLNGKVLIMVNKKVYNKMGRL